MKPRSTQSDSECGDKFTGKRAALLSNYLTFYTTTAQALGKMYDTLYIKV